MAKKKAITTVSEKLAKVNESFTVNIYDNGFLLDIGGRTEDDDWSSAKIMCQTLDQLIALITEVTEMEQAG